MKKNIFTQDELDSMQEVSRIAASEQYKAVMFEKNTAALNSENPEHLGRGKMLADEQKKIAELMERAKNEYMSEIFKNKGYTPDQKVTVNLKTGEVKI